MYLQTRPLVISSFERWLLYTKKNAAKWLVSQNIPGLYCFYYKFNQIEYVYLSVILYKPHTEIIIKFPNNKLVNQALYMSLYTQWILAER